MAVTGERHHLSSGGYRAEISEVGAGLAGLWFENRPVITFYPDDRLPLMSSGAVLVPWPNRIRDGKYRFQGTDRQLPLSEPANHNASHGLARWERWSVLEATRSGVVLGLDLVPQTGYEFPLRLTIAYTLSDTGLTVSVSAVNLGAVDAPFGVGFHPYFDLDGHDIDHAHIEVPADTVLTTDGQQIPVGTEPVEGTPYDLRRLRPMGTLRLDHAFTDLTGDRAVLVVAGLRSELWWEAAFRCLQVFTPPVERFGRTAIAIEPMSCPADAFNSGTDLIVLTPASMWSAAWGVRCSRDPA